MGGGKGDELGGWLARSGAVDALLSRETLISGVTAGILLAGIVPRAVLSILAVRRASQFLYGSVTTNTISILAAGFALALTGAMATPIPAQRDGLADPLQTLRAE